MYFKTKNRYLILSDLDGTLLNNKGKLDDLTIRAVKKLVNNGHVFCILTGRSAEMSLWVYRQLNLKHLLSNYNGSYIWHPNNPEFKVFTFSFNYEVIENILNEKVIWKSVKNIVILNNKGTYISNFPTTKKDKEWYYQNLHITDDGNVFQIDKNLSNIKGVDVRSVILLLNDESKLDEVMYLLHLYSPTLTARLWRENAGGIIIEINSQFACKGTSIDFLSNYYGIPFDNCISFGDGDNDVEMLSTAGHGFAMKNATMTAKIHARYITKHDNDNCGVARELIKFFKLKKYNKKK